MDTLTFVGPDDDGTGLVFADSSSRRFRIHVTDRVRQAVLAAGGAARQHAPAEPGEQLRPRDIQTLIRAGSSIGELVERYGAPYDAIERYAGPVLDERAYFASQAGTIPLAHDPGAPTLAEIVTNRLAGRGVSPDDIVWDAIRPGHTWQVVAHFPADDGEATATWAADLAGRSITALDDDARALTEPERADSPLAGRRLSAVRAEVFDLEADAPPFADRSRDAHPSSRRPAEPVREPPALQLLDDLDDQRGVRVEVELDDEVFERDPGAHPSSGRQARRRGDARILELPARGSGKTSEPDPDPDPDPTPPPKGGRGKRASIPSWDEIVFGARPE